MLKRRQIFIRFREVSSVRGIFRVQRLIHLYGFARGPVRLANAKKHLNVAGGRRVYFLFPRSVLSSSLSLSRILSPPDNCLNIQIYYTRHTHTHARAHELLQYYRRRPSQRPGTYKYYEYTHKNKNEKKKCVCIYI